MNILLCPLSDPGYLYPAIAVGRQLRADSADNHVSLLVQSAAVPRAASAGLPLVLADDYGGPRSFRVFRWFYEGLGQYRTILRVAREARADVLVTSVLCHGALLAAEVLDIPVVVLGLAAHLWEYQAGGQDEPEQPVQRSWRTRDMLRYYSLMRDEAGIPGHFASSPDHPLLGTMVLLRGDPALEYPGAVLPERVQHVGPCTWEPRPDPAEVGAVMAHVDRVGKPVVYVHLGRTFGGASLWPRLNAAFTGGPFQAVVEQGRSRDPRPAPGSDILLVRKPWMGPLIDRAGLVLTSGTSAPVLAGLLRGRLLAVSPAGSEQPMLATACVRAGVALPVVGRVPADPAAELRSAWQDQAMRARARQLGERLARADGAKRAAGIIQRIAAGRPARISRA